MRAPLATAVAVVTGVLVLLGYFLPFAFAQVLRSTLLQWAVILAAFAFLVGVLNLAGVHWNKIKTGQPGSFYSFILLLSLVATVVVVGIFSPTGEWSIWIFNSIQVPVEASLMAILSVILIYSSVRLLRRRLNLMSVVFLVTTVLVLLGSVPILFLEQITVFNQIRSYIVEVFSVGGGRGILIGVALGTIATGIRILIWSDRPYSG